MKAGVEDKAARDHAEYGVEDYRKGIFNPAGMKKPNAGVKDLIDQRIKLAKKQ